MTEQDQRDLPAADDWLEHALVANAREHRADYVADDGFTQRVMTSLPPPEKLPAWRTPAVFLLWATAAVGGIVAMPDLTSEIARGVLRLLGDYPVSLSQIATGLVAMGVATWAAAAIAVRRS